MSYLLHHIAMVLGLTDINGSWYAWWSGVGSDLAEIGLLIGATRSIRTLRRQREEHHTQLVATMKEVSNG